MKMENSGWLCSSDTINTHDVSENDLEQLFEMAELEDE